MASDQFGRDLEEDLGYDLDLLDEDEYENTEISSPTINEVNRDEDARELSRIRREDIRYMNGDR